MCQNSRQSPLTGIVGTSDNRAMKVKSAIDVEALIEKAGGLPRLMTILGVARTTVLDWKRTGFIPANRVGQISDALGVPLKDVQKLAPKPKPKRRPAANTSSESAVGKAA